MREISYTDSRKKIMDIFADILISLDEGYCLAFRNKIAMLKGR